MTVVAIQTKKPCHNPTKTQPKTTQQWMFFRFNKNGPRICDDKNKTLKKMLRLEDALDLKFNFEKELDAIDEEELERDQPVCKFYLKGSCRMGKDCKFRHSKQVTKEKEVVCKHWLRGLCKKGEGCEFLHQYKAGKMPECWFFSEYGECSNLECIFLHIRPEDKIKNCPWYDRGFCKHGPNCRLKHLRKVPCPDYLAGFCAKGPNCKFSHPKFDNRVNEAENDGGAKFMEQMDAKRQAAMREQQGQQGQGGPMAPRRPFESSDQQPPRRPLSEVTCNLCKEQGHYANKCPMRGKRNFQQMQQ